MLCYIDYAINQNIKKMQKIISKRDNKEYFLCKASEAADYTYFDYNGRTVSLYGKGKYQVRKSETPGNVVFNGVIWDYSQEHKSNPIEQINGYTGTNVFGCEIPSTIAKEIFTYLL